MGSRVTIKDVAREAGVSIKTVSNVLNNSGSMRPETRQRVEQTMRRLGYTLNVSARAMRSGGTRLIGLGIFDFSQPFAPYLADIVIDYARQHEYGVIINTYGSGSRGLPAIIDDTYRLGADGWLFFTERPLANEGAILNQPYPVVLTGDYLSYGKSDLVTMPNRAAISDVTGRYAASAYAGICAGFRTAWVAGRLGHGHRHAHLEPAGRCAGGAQAAGLRRQAGSDHLPERCHGVRCDA